MEMIDMNWKDIVKEDGEYNQWYLDEQEQAKDDKEFSDDTHTQYNLSSEIIKKLEEIKKDIQERLDDGITLVPNAAQELLDFLNNWNE